MSPAPRLFNKDNAPTLCYKQDNRPQMESLCQAPGHKTDTSLSYTLGSLRSRLKPVHQSPDQHSSSGDLPAGRPAHPLFPKGKELCGNQPTFLPRKLPCSHSRLPVGSFTVPSPWSAFPSTELNAAGFESIFVQISS